MAEKDQVKTEPTEGSEPEGSEPEGSEPESNEPESNEPETNEPEGSDPEGLDLGGYTLDIGEDLLAEALQAVEKRLYTKKKTGEGSSADDELEFEIELDETDPSQGPSGVEMKLVERIEALTGELEDTRQTARDTRDEGLLALKKAERKAKTAEALKLELDDARANAQSNEQLAKELRGSLKDLNDESHRAKKRHRRVLEQTHQQALDQVCKELLPVVDNLQLANKHVPENLANDTFVEGLLMTVVQLERALERIGVEPLAVEPGDTFDPQRHEAIASEPHPTIPRGDIIEILQVGYQLKDRLIRAARVTVSGDELGAQAVAEE
jgi:molecular chaperone GrpE